MAEQCPLIVGDGVYGQVVTVMGNMWSNAETAFAVSIEALGDLGSLSLESIPVNTHLNVDTDWWSVRRPKAPVEPELVWDPNTDLIPAPPSGDTGPDPNFTAPPTFTATAPSIPVRTAPGPLTATPPEGPPDLDPVSVPAPPELVLPDFPELREIEPLPEPPTITLPTFQGVRPTFSVAVPVNTFGFEPQNYSSALLDKIKSRISVMIDGAPGLPAAAAAAMRARATVAIDREGMRAEQDAVEAFSTRGFPEPNGVLYRKLDEVRQGNQDRRNALSRDIYIKDVDIAIEDLRFAIAQGVGLEGQLMGNFLGIQQLALDAAKANVQIAIEVANAEIAVANLELQAYQTDAQVHRDLIQAELAKIEVYRAELEGKRLIGELNAQDVAIFSERVKFVLSQVEIYNARINGVRAVSEINIARVQAFGETVKAYEGLVDAKRVEWDAYGKQLEADLIPFRRYELEAGIFNTRSEIWARTNTNLIDQKRLRLSERELDITAYRARLERLDSAIRAESQRLDAIVRIYGSRIDKYRADAAIEQVVSEGNARPFQLALEQEAKRVDTELQNAQLRITQATRQAEILTARKQAIGQIGGTLAAGLASAMSVHAGISSSLSQGQSCATSYNHTIDDNA